MINEAFSDLAKKERAFGASSANNAKARRSFAANNTKRGFSDLFNAAKQAFGGNKPEQRQRTKAEYDLERKNKRSGADEVKSLVPLEHSEEAKVRQLSKRLDPEQAEELGKRIGELIQAHM